MTLAVANEKREGSLANIEEITLVCANLALDKKAANLVIIHIAALSSLADYFIICTGTSDKHTAAIAAAVQKGMKERGLLPIGTAGKGSNAWIALDYGDVLIHVFLEPIRSFYDLEGLWGEAPMMWVANGIYNISEISFPNNRRGNRRA